MAAPMNFKRIVIGGMVGGVCWNIWSMLVNIVFLADQYAAGQAAGHLLESPRYGYFLGAWIVILLLLGMGLAWLYAAVRNTLGPGPGTAFKVGLMAALIGSVPGNFAQASWSALPRMLALWWLLDVLVGAVLATLVAGWLYREK